MAPVADAVVSAFLVKIEPVPLVPLALDVLGRRHLLIAQRSALADADLRG